MQIVEKFAYSFRIWTNSITIEGIKYDSNGENILNLWSSKDARRYSKRPACLESQYSNYKVPGTGGMKVTIMSLMKYEHLIGYY